MVAERWKHCMMAAGLAVLVSASQAAAQSPPEGEPPSRLQMKSGALTVTPAVRLVDVGVETNVFSEGKRASDFTTTVEPQLEARIQRTRLDVRATGRAGLVYYQEFASERAFNPGFRLQADLRRSSRLEFYGDADVGYTNGRSGPEVDARVRSFARLLKAGTRIGGHKLQLDVNGSFTDVEVDESEEFMNVHLEDTLNRTVQLGSVKLLHHLTPYTGLTFTGEGLQQRFPRAPERDIDSVSGTVGLELSPQALIGGSAAIGYRSANPLNDITPDFSGLIYRGGISSTVRDRLSLSVGVERDIDPSYRYDAPYYEYDLYEAGVQQVLWRRLDVGISGSRTKIKYHPFTSGTFEGDLRETLDNLTVSVGLRVTRHNRVSGYISQWRRGGGANPYKDIQVGMMVTVGRVAVSERGVFLNGPTR
jgi:hypothetical protein